jgi:NADH:ubiquinone oxidoreductase subunit E/NAD-dependent dihydropyrimidine dehydrogenase PreA subunit
MEQKQDIENSKETPVGAVLVVGGGIGGIQSSLDLANSGFKVYLLESGPVIGGQMAKLDKTFPTNDCSMCIISPKLVECGAHPNIEKLTYADLQKVEGEPGKFKITIKKRARSVDESLCTGCGECINHCLVRNQPYIEPRQVVEPPLPEDDKRIVEEILDRYGEHRSPLIPVLQDISGKFNYLPEPVLYYVSFKLNIPMAHVLRVATFYAFFSLKPRGKHLVSVCMGTACHVRGGERILEKLEEELGIRHGQTTDDKKFSLEMVRCLGCCALSPVVKVDERVYSRVRYNTVMDILTRYE